MTMLKDVVEGELSVLNCEDEELREMRVYVGEKTHDNDIYEKFIQTTTWTRWEGSIYYGKTNLVFNNENDFNMIKRIFPKIQEVLLLKIPLYNTELYVVSHSSIERLRQVFQ